MVLRLRSESSAAAFSASGSKSPGKIFVVRKISSRATALCSSPSPTCSSFPYARAVSICR
jgi:hypothetical protein